MANFLRVSLPTVPYRALLLLVRWLDCPYIDLMTIWEVIEVMKEIL